MDKPLESEILLLTLTKNMRSRLETKSLSIYKEELAYDLEQLIVHNQ